MILNKATNHTVTCFNSRSFVVHSSLEKNKFVRVVIPELSSSRVDFPTVHGSKFYSIFSKKVVIELDSEEILKDRQGDLITISL